MDHYHVWFNLRDPHRDLAFANDVEAYMARLRAEGLIEGHRLARRKLGFGPPGLGDFHLDMVTRGLDQLEAAFQRVARREGEVEKLHAAVYGQAKDVVFALYRDFPDAVRAR